MKRLRMIPLILAGLIALAGGISWKLVASDHDDGEINQKGRALNLTDLYVFREKDQNGSALATDLILIMNSNPRSLPQQQYYFSSTARYEFHATRVEGADKAKRTTGREDIIIRFTFSDPDTTNTQNITVETVKDGNSSTATATTGGAAIKTTPLPGTSEVINTVSVGGSNLTIFAGLREDPFFFDVKRFFILRGCLVANSTDSNPFGKCAGLGKAFGTSSTAEDFAHGYNVNSIVVRAPVAFFQTATTQTHFDFWEIITVQN